MTTFNGTADDDIFTGGGDADLLLGNGGNDVLGGGGGSDILAGGSGADKLDGGDGDDWIYAGERSPGFNLPYYGNPWTAPVLDTGVEHDVLIGGAGADRLFAGYGDDVDGGEGGYSGDYLYISFMGAQTGVTADFRQATLTIGGGTIKGVENISWVQGSDYDDDLNVGSSYSGGYSDFTAVFGMGGNDRLTAGYYTGTLFGGDGNDIVDGRGSQYLQAVDGGAGDDILYTNSNTFGSAYGGDGNDTIYAHGRVSGGAGNDLIVMQTTYYAGSVDGDAGDDEIRASTGGNSMAGGDGADTLIGSDGADRLYSGARDANGDTPLDDMGRERDKLSGGGGDDILAAGYGDDVDGGTGKDSLRFSLGGALNGVTFDTTGIVSGQPFAFAGGSISNVETLVYLRGSEFSDTLNLATQAELLTVDAGAGDDVITSNGSSVQVNGGSGDDRFVSGVAGDIFDGGAGFDTVDYSGYARGVTVDLTGAGAGGDQLLNVEVVIGSGFDDTLRGDGSANRLDGGAGDDLLAGGRGDDTLIGGQGMDTATFASSQGGVKVDLALTGAQNTGEGFDTLIGIESLVGSGFADTLKGDAGGNRLDGGVGDDVISGGAGDDILIGGAGFDIVSFASATAAVTVDLSIAGAQNTGEGSDTFSGFEGLIGSRFSDVLRGDGGDNRLEGGLGDDTLIGGGGSDTAVYANAEAAVTVDLSIAGAQNTGQGSDTLSGIENLLGSQYADTLKGDAGANVIDGGAGADLIVGGLGDDTLAGGAGVDIVSFTVSGAAVTVDLSGGVATGEGADKLSGFENVVGSRFGDTLIGDAGDNRLEGGDGDDILIGLMGNDTLIGGAGSDTASYAISLTAVKVDLSITGAQDTGQGLDTFQSIEQVRGSSYSDVLKGDAGANKLYGAAGDDVLSGGGGDDYLDGGDGFDTVRYDGFASDYLVVSNGSTFTVTDLRAGSPNGVDTLVNIENFNFIPTPSAATLNLEIASILRQTTQTGAIAQLAQNLLANWTGGQITSDQVINTLIKTAGATTSVATMSYQFFTGKIPGQNGVDYLVSPTGPNANNLNSAYYQSFNLENRYINFAVNLGKNGEGKDAFAAKYGALTLFEATREAYKTIFGAAPGDAKVHDMIDSRVGYFASYSGDGPTGIGTKAAMVGWLLAEAQKADVGVLARSNDAWLTDLADGSAPFAIDILDPSKGYYQADFIFGG